jgi:hypothetical protein
MSNDLKVAGPQTPDPGVPGSGIPGSRIPKGADPKSADPKRSERPRTDDLKLLIEWSSPWDEFRSALHPALTHSPRPLAGEAPVGIFPYRGMLATWGAEILLFALVVYLSGSFDTIRVAQTPAPAKYDVIYFSGEELPRTRDVGGAQSGHSGRSGGREAHHPTQVIRVARGESLREKVVDAPKLKLPKSDSAVANLLAFQRIPGPPPTEGMKSSLRAPSLAQLAAIAPAPDVNRQQMRSEATLGAAVVPPAPSAGDITSLRLPGSHPVQVVPPPVSAPERISSANARLTLPAPTVVAPPPQISQQISRTGPGFGPGDLQKQVVPPPAQLGSNTGQRHPVSGLGTAAVVPPPVQLGNSTGDRRTVATLGAGPVVPPPAQLGSGVISRQSQQGLAGGTAVIAPPPTLSGEGSPSGRGRGAHGAGLGGLGDVGELAAPPNSGGNGKGAGIVISNQPGAKVGVPGSGGAGSLAMSPQGNSNTGLGGYGGGNGISRGNGPGSGLSGEGSGAGRDGSGHGSDPSARGGISPYPGKGGTGTAAAGDPAAPGVEVSGGSSVVNLPSFSQGGNEPTDPARSSASREKGTGITIVATPRSGGAFNFYGAMKGDKVYTRYIDTTLGIAVMQFSDPATAAHPYMEELTSPQPVRVDLPSGLRRSRLVIACVLDRTGVLRNPQVLDSVEQATTTRVLAALANWKFSPALRGNQPVEVNAILGFGIDTNDRY